jgi:hypothetical protein
VFLLLVSVESTVDFINSINKYRMKVCGNSDQVHQNLFNLEADMSEILIHWQLKIVPDVQEACKCVSALSVVVSPNPLSSSAVNRVAKIGFKP